MAILFVSNVPAVLQNTNALREVLLSISTQVSESLRKYKGILAHWTFKTIAVVLLDESNSKTGLIDCHKMTKASIFLVIFP